MAIDPYVGCNFTLPSQNCTLETCCLAQSSFEYIPSYGANLFFAIFFGLFIVFQAAMMIVKKTWGFGIGMITGLVLEVIGYAARILINDNPFNKDAFLMYLICATIAPVFITAAIYLCLTRIIVLYNTHLSPFHPRTLAIFFMSSDFGSLLLQAIGGAIADTADDKDTSRVGINVMIAGLFLQAISLAAFLAFVFFYGYRVKTGYLNQDTDRVACRNRTFFKAFLVGTVVSTIAVLIRSIFRVAELWGGFSGRLWNDEVDFLVLDGAMMLIAVLLLTILHPGFAFKDQWAQANWTFRRPAKDSADTSLRSLKPRDFAPEQSPATSTPAEAETKWAARR